MTLNQPAGHLEDNESLIEAAIRETLEETAWQVEVESLIGIYRWRHPVSTDTYLRFCFKGKPIQQLDQSLDDDIHQAVWLSADEIRQCSAQHRSPLVNECIEDYLAGQHYSLDLLHN